MNRPIVIAIVGAGPRGLAMLERLAANAPELAGPRPVQIHLIDPHPAGGGRIWRTDQPDELLMNSLAHDVTMYVDDSVRCRGPLRDGPTLLDWAQERGRDNGLAEADRHRYTAVRRGGVASRRVQAEYLTAVLDRVLRELPPSVTVHTHATTAEDLRDQPDGRQRLTLAGREPLDADAVVFTVGHLDIEPDEREARLADAAARAGLHYVPPHHTAEADLGFIRPGEPVLMRGAGLGFIDLMALMFEGQGGRFEPAGDDGRLVYRPHGGEPRLLVGSRRGVPYQAKPAQQLIAERAPLPRFFTRPVLGRLMREHPKLDMWRHIRPLIEREVGWGYYHELFNGHPDRVRGDWAEFAERFVKADDDELRALIAETVAPDDVLDLDGRNSPLRGLTFDTHQELQIHLRELMVRSVHRQTDPHYSAEAGAFQGFLAIFMTMGLLWHSGRLNARSQTEGLAWWRGMFNHFTSGPPPRRMRQMHALAEAGFIEFVGADMWVEVDEPAGVFRAGGSTTPETFTARALVEARLPTPSLERARDPLLRSLAARGLVSEEIVSDGSGDGSAPIGTGLVRVTPSEARVVDAAGVAHPARFALGAFTTLRSSAGFHRPCTGSGGIRQNDLVARTALTAAGGSDQAVRTA